MVNATHVTEEVRFESEEEIKDRYTEVNFESGDVMGAGVPIISTGRTAYVDDSEASTFVVGASGSGKTRKILMPYTLSCIRKNENLVIHDPKALTCEIFEIKYSEKVVPEQYRHLVNSEKCAETEHRFGTITNKAVIYRGEKTVSDDINYLNVEEYLKSFSKQS